MQDWTTTQDAREYAINMLLLLGLMCTCIGIAIIGHWLLQWWHVQSRKVDTLLTSPDDLKCQQQVAPPEPSATVSLVSSDEGVPEDFADVWQILEQAAWHHAKPYQRHWQRTHGNPGYFTRREVLLLCQLEERYHRGDYYPEWRQEDGGRVA